jgi:WD40 repeat protein
MSTFSLLNKTEFILNNILIASTIDGSIKIWSLSNNTLLKTIKAHDTSINNVISLNNSQNFATLSNEDKTIKIWNSQSFVLLKTLKLDYKVKNNFIINVNDNNIVLLNTNNEIIRWNFDESPYNKSIKVDNGEIVSLIGLPILQKFILMTNSCKLFISSSKFDFLKLNFSGFECSHLSAVEIELCCITVAVNDELLFYNINTGYQLYQKINLNNNIIKLTSSKDVIGLLLNDSSIRTLNVKNHSFGNSFSSNNDSIVENGFFFATKIDSFIKRSPNRITIWNYKSRNIVYINDKVDPFQTQLSIVDDGKYLIFKSEDGSIIKIWNSIDAQFISSIKNDVYSIINRLITLKLN